MARTKIHRVNARFNTGNTLTSATNITYSGGGSLSATNVSAAITENETNIATNTASINTLTTNLATATGNIATNTASINTLTTNLASATGAFNASIVSLSVATSLSNGTMYFTVKMLDDLSTVISTSTKKVLVEVLDTNVNDFFRQSISVSAGNTVTFTGTIPTINFSGSMEYGTLKAGPGASQPKDRYIMAAAAGSLRFGLATSASFNGSTYYLKVTPVVYSDQSLTGVQEQSHPVVIPFTMP